MDGGSTKLESWKIKYINREGKKGKQRSSKTKNREVCENLTSFAVNTTTIKQSTHSKHLTQTTFNEISNSPNLTGGCTHLLSLALFTDPPPVACDPRRSTLLWRYLSWIEEAKGKNDENRASKCEVRRVHDEILSNTKSIVFLPSSSNKSFCSLL